MPRTRVDIYQEKDGEVPLLEWLDAQPEKVVDKCEAAIEKLKERGYDLRRPTCDYLRHDIYELRTRYRNVHYRILYSFVGESVVLLSHGCTKKKNVPQVEIKRAIVNRNKYKQNPRAHTYHEEL